MKRSSSLLFNVALQADIDMERLDSCMQKLWNLSSLLALRKTAALMRKTDSLGRVKDAEAAVIHAGESMNIEEDSSCRVVWNIMCLNIQLIPGL